jgi:hypothetical protein
VGLKHRGNLLSAPERGNRAELPGCRKSAHRDSLLCIATYLILSAYHSSSRMIEYFPNYYVFMRVSNRSYALSPVPEPARRAYVAVQDVGAGQSGERNSKKIGD